MGGTSVCELQSLWVARGRYCFPPLLVWSSILENCKIEVSYITQRTKTCSHKIAWKILLIADINAFRFFPVQHWGFGNPEENFAVRPVTYKGVKKRCFRKNWVKIRRQLTKAWVIHEWLSVDRKSYTDKTPNYEFC